MTKAERAEALKLLVPPHSACLLHYQQRSRFAIEKSPVKTSNERTQQKPPQLVENTANGQKNTEKVVNAKAPLPD